MWTHKDLEGKRKVRYYKDMINTNLRNKKYLSENLIFPTHIFGGPCAQLTHPISPLEPSISHIRLSIAPQWALK